MPGVARLGDMCTGHGCFPPRPNIGGSHDVFINGIPVHRQGDSWPVHCCNGSCHDGVLARGSHNVFVNGVELGRIGDPVSCGSHVAIGSTNVFAGDTSEDARREQIFSHLTDAKDKLILCLPEIAAAEYGRVNERDRIGWDYFHGFISKWLHGKAYSIKDKYDNGGQEPAYLDWNWLMRFERFEHAVGKMLQQEYMFSEAAQDKLTSLLEYDGAFEGESSTFDYINLPWSEQRKHAFQSYPMNIIGLSSIAPPMPDGLQVAVANVSIFALAAGHSKTFEDGTRQVFVERIALFIHDGFDFNGEQPLGKWTCTENEKSFDYPFGTSLGNIDFNLFREHTRYGCDFRTMTVPELVWTGVYKYDVK